MADAKKAVDLEGLGAAIGKIKEDYAKKTEIPSMNYATEAEILTLFEDSPAADGDIAVDDEM